MQAQPRAPGFQAASSATSDHAPRPPRRSIRPTILAGSSSTIFGQRIRGEWTERTYSVGLHPGTPQRSTNPQWATDDQAGQTRSGGPLGLCVLASESRAPVDRPDRTLGPGYQVHLPTNVQSARNVAFPGEPDRRLCHEHGEDEALHYYIVNLTAWSLPTLARHFSPSRSTRPTLKSRYGASTPNPRVRGLPVPARQPVAVAPSRDRPDARDRPLILPRK